MTCHSRRTSLAFTSVSTLPRRRLPPTVYLLYTISSRLLALGVHQVRPWRSLTLPKFPATIKSRMDLMTMNYWSTYRNAPIFSPQRMPRLLDDDYLPPSLDFFGLHFGFDTLLSPSPTDSVFHVNMSCVHVTHKQKYRSSWFTSLKLFI
ncbi:uncharacterized protein LOC130764919 [Actinidia eriantha]|uniref:uncharacterized protein LOC130764919 n=1 Tax=Actinidia eriantha TaxID=165200 RepID=UPI00258FD197|nr:uncharacterized protein LOC130764919 [Actinidia eriantha]